MKKLIAILLSVLMCFCTVSCGQSDKYIKITPQEAKQMMDDGDPYILLDVRTQVEHNLKYIDGSIVIPHKELKDRAPAELPDKNARILVYCATGVRSETASRILSDMGYNNVYDFGGIDKWGYETVEE